MRSIASLAGLIFFYTFVCLGTTASGQGLALPDSLRQLLLRFGESTKNEQLKKEIAEARLYADGPLSDSLAEKLLAIEAVCFNDLELPQPLLLAYGETVADVFAQRPPPKQHRCYSRALSGLAFFYEQTGAYEKAVSLYEQSLAVLEKTTGEADPGYARNLNSLASVHERMGDYEKALRFGERGLAMRKKTADEKQRRDTVSLLAYAESLTTVSVILYLELDECRRALPLVEEALSIRLQLLGEENAYCAENINNLAGIYESMGDYEKAAQLYRREAAIMKNTVGEDHPDYAYTLNDMAYLHENMGEYDKALQLYSQALSLRKKTLGTQHAYYASSLNNLSALYWKLGNYAKAISLAEEASSVNRKALGEENGDYAISLNNLARILTDAGQYERAMDFSRRAIAIRKKYGQQDHYYVACLKTQAGLWKRLGKYSEALSSYTEAKNITEALSGKESPAYGACLQSLAELYQQQGNVAAALPLMEEAQKIFENTLGPEHPDYANSLNSTAALLESEGRNGEAADLLVRASAGKINHLSRTYTFLSEQEKMAFAGKELLQFAYLPSLFFHKGRNAFSAFQQMYANELSLKGMVLEDQRQVLRSIKGGNDSLALSVFEQWRANKTFLGRQWLLPLQQRVPYFDSLQDATNHLEQRLSQLSAAFRQQQQRRRLSASNVVQKLAKKEAALEFIRFPYYNKKWTDSVMYAALLLLPGDGTPRFIPLCEEKQLRRLLSVPSNKEAVIALQELYRPETDRRYSDFVYQLIWRPLEKYLSGVQTVYVAPAGLLHQVCFNALRDDKSRSLIARYNLRQVLSTRTVALPAALVSKPSSAVLWGGIAYNRQQQQPVASRSGTPSAASEAFTRPEVSSFDFYAADTRNIRKEGFVPLPFSKKEIQAVKNTFRSKGIPARTLSDTVASEEAFKALDGKSPHVIHLATHGFFLPVAERKNEDAGAANTFTVQQNPMFRSGLVLAGGNSAWRGEPCEEGKEDGILTAYEIAQLDLSNTELVVLSACQTALGDVQANEGVIGLQRAFKLAGVKQMILSLWSVPDKETKELMTTFYGHWLNGQTAREALRKAQLKMKEKYRPFYWAGFVLIE